MGKDNNKGTEGPKPGDPIKPDKGWKPGDPDKRPIVKERPSKKNK